MTQINHPQTEAIIIGGGLAGLATAVTLSREGFNVTLLERSRLPGGRAQTTAVNGVYFNQGPHALYIEGAARRILADLGLQINGSVPHFKRSLAIYQAGSQSLPAAPVQILTSPLFTWSEKWQLVRLLLELRRVDPGPWMSTTLEEWLALKSSSRRLREFLLALARVFTYANAPGQMSAGVFLIQARMGLNANVLYLDHGWQTLVDQLLQLALAGGVAIHTRSRVTAIDPIRRQVTLADGTSCTAGTVILAVDPHAAAALLPGSRSLQQAAAHSRPVQVAVLDLALRRLPVPENQFALGFDRPTYFSIHSTAARLGPGGVSVIQMARYLAPGDDDPDRDLAELEDLLDWVQPGWQDEVITRRFLPRLTVNHALPLAETGGLAGRPAVAVPEYEQIYLAGDWVGSQGWLADAALASAAETAGLIIDRKKTAVSDRPNPTPVLSP